MKRLGSAVRYGAVGVILAGVFSTIVGCSAQDAIRALLVILGLMLGSGGGEEGATAGTPPPVTEIVIYSAGQHTGNLKAEGNGANGREGADNLCIAAKPADVTNPTVRAFITVDAFGPDDIASMPFNFGVPTNLPVKTTPSAGGAILVNTWGDLTGKLPDTLDGLGITDPSDGGGVGSLLWWSGIPSGGIPFTCQGWTSESPIGWAGRTNSTFVPEWRSAASFDCNNQAELLCVAF